MKITLIANAPNAHGLPSIQADNGQSRLIQTDWDYPGIANTFGWDKRSIQACPTCKQLLNVAPRSGMFACHNCGDKVSLICQHDATDGTINCHCELTAGHFITSARQWIDDHDRATTEDPGYFADTSH